METKIEEIWRDVVGYEGLYQVSSIGRVKSLSRPRILKVKIGGWKGDYVTVSIWKNAWPTTAFVHRLVCMAFHDNPENKATVNHKNGIKHDNRYENLEWATYTENQIHAIRSGLKIPNRGSDRYNSKLTESNVAEILKLRNDGIRLKDIANRFGVCIPLISGIINRRVWRHVKP